MKWRRIVPIVVVVLAALLVNAWSIPPSDVPDPLASVGRQVQDSGQVLSEEYLDLIDSLCRELQRVTQAQMAVVTVDNLNGEPVEDYAETLFQQWGIGDTDRDDGLLILFSRDDRKVRLEVGYGLEPAINDARAGRMLRDIATPKFKQGYYGQGLYLLAVAVADHVTRASGQPYDFTPPDPLPPERILSSSSAASSSAIALPYPTALLIYTALLLGFSGLTTIIFLLRFHAYRARAAKVHLSKKYLFGVPALSVLGMAGFIGLIMLYDKGIIGFFIMFFTFLVTIPLQWLLRQKMLAKAEAYTPDCARCHRPMRLIGEEEDNQFLTREEIAEENVLGMDYEFWACDACNRQERFNVRLDGADRCKQCRRYTLLHHEQIITKATTKRKGKKKVTSTCANPLCAYVHTRFVTIPRVSSSSSGSSRSGFSSSGGGSWGGGSSGGGGASGSW